MDAPTSSNPAESVLAIWRRHCAARPGILPARQDFDPIEMGPQVIPLLAIVELEAGGRLRFRLCGSGLARFAGLDLTGCYVDELNPNKAYAAYITGLYMMARDARLPVLSNSEFRGRHGLSNGTTMRLICPLAYDGLAIDHFITAQTFHQDAGITGTLTMTYASDFKSGEMRVLQDGDSL
ncbi:MAG: PAS domain-containing protein [Alphaproteobacteria bacterium]|nr:PAS domain-containing protein [Alphaproteobacteria bacterium]